MSASKQVPVNLSHSNLQKWTHGKTVGAVWNILLIQLNCVIYAMSFWMQQPVLPFIIESLGSNDDDEKLGIKLGYFQTIVSLGQLIGGPLMGRFTDKSGAKNALIICQIASAFSYFFLGSSISLQLLFISRVTAILQQVMQTSQACVAQLTDDIYREQALGKLSMAYGIGMILGSTMSGLITRYFSITFNAFFAGFLSLSVAVLDFIFLPPLKVSENTNNNKKCDFGGIINNFKEILSLASRPIVRGLCLVLFFGGFGIHLYRSMFTVIFKDVFGFEGWQLGFFIAYAALTSTLSNSFFVGWAKSRYSDNTIIQSCAITIALTLGIFGYGCAYQFMGIRGLCILTIPQTIASGFLYVMISGYISKIVNKNEMGTALALIHALRSFTGVIAPTIGGHLVDFGYQYIGYFGFFSGILSVILFKVLL
eukprot:359681_1